jgi:hypothetical protein
MTSPPPPAVVSTATLAELAMTAREKYRDIDRAKSWMLDQINDNPKLRNSLLLQMIDTAVGTYVYRARAQVLSELKTRRSTLNIDSIAEMSGTFAKSFLKNWTMPDGRVLADYTGPELTVEAAENRNAAGALARKAEFYGKLAVLAKDKKVGDALDDERAEKLWEATE